MGPNSPGQKRNAKALDMISNTLPFHLGCLITIGYRLAIHCSTTDFVERHCLHDSYYHNNTPDGLYAPLLAT